MSVKAVAKFGVQGADVQHHDVDPAATVERVDTVLALEPVAVAATPQLVSAAATEHLVLTASALEEVVTTGCVGPVVQGVPLSVEPISGKEVVPVPADQGVLSQVAVEPVATAAAEELAADLL